MSPTQFQREIFDFEIWVTPVTRYLVMCRLNQLPMSVEYPAEDYIQEADPQDYRGGPAYLFEHPIKGQQIVQQLQALGHYVRLKEASKPRFGESLWMMTNRIKKGVD